MASASDGERFDLTDEEEEALFEAGPGERKCARCEKVLGEIYASVWTKATGEIFYCHDDDGSCYVTATRESYPELRVTEERRW